MVRCTNGRVVQILNGQVLVWPSGSSSKWLTLPSAVSWLHRPSRATVRQAVHGLRLRARRCGRYPARRAASRFSFACVARFRSLARCAPPLKAFPRDSRSALRLGLPAQRGLPGARQRSTFPHSADVLARAAASVGHDASQFMSDHFWALAAVSGDVAPLPRNTRSRFARTGAEGDVRASGRVLVPVQGQGPAPWH